MPSILLRSEAASSSQIENLTAGARNIAIAELNLKSGGNAELIAANVHAMQRALEGTPEVSLQTILDTHANLLSHTDPDIAGQIRAEQVWIGASSLSPHDADFVPPHHEHVPGLLDDLVIFGARRDIPTLAHAALVHAQFETIHPFTYGNGRTGRAIMHTLLRARGATRHSTVPVSSGLLHDTGGYFRALDAYREGDLAPIVRQSCHAALAAIANGRQLADDITRAREIWRDSVTARSDSAAWKLIDLLVQQPVINVERVVHELGITDRGARNAIDVLEAADVLRTATTAKRDRIWQAPAILVALDAFAARSGRRRRP